MDGDLFRHRHRIDSARLTGYDYGSNGIYFVTICTHNRETYFGAVETQHPSGGETQDVASLRPTAIGQVAIDCWYAIPDHFPFVQLDAFQMMPNHLHGVLWICKPDYDDRDGQPNTFGPQRQNLASVIRGYKVGVKKYAMVHGIEFMWQPRYYDRVVRSPNELNRIRTYIDLNPDKWVDDRENLQNLYM